jgi:hypothetical protein
MAINVGKMVVGDKTVAETLPSPTEKKVVKSLSDVRKRAQPKDRLRDPEHLKLHEIDEDRKVSQYMLDMYNNELISFDK